MGLSGFVLQPYILFLYMPLINIFYSVHEYNSAWIMFAMLHVFAFYSVFLDPFSQYHV